MRIPFLLLLIATITLSSCAGWRNSGANPSNWFGGREPPSAAPTGVPTNPSDRQTGNPLIDEQGAATLVRRNTSTVQQTGIFRRRTRQVPYQGTTVDLITNVRFERIPSGGIVRVEGEPVREGAFDVRLLRVNPDGPINGVMEYTLNALQPADFGRGTETTRKIEAGAFLDNGELAQIRTIRIIGTRNVQTVTP